MLVQSEIVTLLNELLNQSAKLRKGGNQAVYYCPACNHYKRKLEVNLETGQWHCWTCNIKGSFLGSFLTKVKASKSFRERLFKITGDLRLARKASKKIYSDVVIPEQFISLSNPTSSIEYRNAIAYLKRRGVTQEDIIRYNIGYCEEGDYAYHIIIPSYDANGNLNFFIGRRYYNSEGVIPHKKPEVSMDNIIGFESFINWDEPLNLCEGVFDCFAIRNNAIPLFGKYPSSKLREKMVLNNTRQVNIVLDSDAREDAIRNCELLMKQVPDVEVRIVKLDGKDPSDLGFEKTHEAIRQTTKAIDFMDLLAYRLKI